MGTIQDPVSVHVPLGQGQAPSPRMEPERVPEPCPRLAVSSPGCVTLGSRAGTVTAGVSFSTTHWKQVLFMMDEPVPVHVGDVVTGSVVLQRNPVWRRHMSVTLSWSVASGQDPTAQKVRRSTVRPAPWCWSGRSVVTRWWWAVGASVHRTGNGAAGRRVVCSVTRVSDGRPRPAWGPPLLCTQEPWPSPHAASHRRARRGRACALTGRRLAGAVGFVPSGPPTAGSLLQTRGSFGTSWWFLFLL